MGWEEPQITYSTTLRKSCPAWWVPALVWGWGGAPGREGGAQSKIPLECSSLEADIAWFSCPQQNTWSLAGSSQESDGFDVSTT